MPISDLARQLAANELHLVVFGPGYGESIAVHVPDGAWLVTDSLAGRGRWPSTFVPAVELLKERGEKAALLVLTHPHDDHAAGFDRLVTGYVDGPVGVVGMHLPELGFTEDDAGTDVLAKTNRAKALVAIFRHWRDNPEYEWRLIADGTSRALGSGLVEVLHPNQAYVDARTPDPGTAPNNYSTPVLVEWGSVRLVLGADLPSAEWRPLLGPTRIPSLSDHVLLKVAHHGSMNAQLDELVLAEAATAGVALTPWNLGRRMLPALDVSGGVHWLLRNREAVSLTAIGRALTRRLPQPVSVTQLNGAVERRSLPGGGVMEVRLDYDPDESWVAFSFDRSGALVRTAYGREARRVES
jgi:beta-lactamase superfamily II metal-dependent hydrolase